MTIELAVRRRCYAEEIGALANLPPDLVEALAEVPRERFLPPGPWLVRGEADVAAPRLTATSDAAHVYHNYAIAIDAERQLFNGGPALIGRAIDALAVHSGDRVLHVGAGLGYYTAVLGVLAGPGHVVGVEVDADLALRAQALAAPGVTIGAGDGAGPLDGTFDAILINAGVTHPLAAWLDALRPAGRMVLPLTAPMPPMGATLGKGLLLLLTRRDDADFDARVLTFVAIYSALGIRDEATGAQLGAAMMRSPMPRLNRLTRRPHDASAACWLHTATWCLGVG